MFSITLWGEPYSKLRPRATMRGKSFRMYDPLSSKKNAVACVMRAKQIREDAYVMQGAVRINFKFYSQPNKKNRIEDLWNGDNHIVKPDIDNLIKFYLDCASGVLFADDRQVVECNAIKYYSENPRTEITIERLDLNEIEQEDKNIIYNFSPKQLKEFGYACKTLGEYFQNIEEMAEKGLGKHEGSVVSALLKTFADNWGKVITKIGKL